MRQFNLHGQNKQILILYCRQIDSSINMDSSSRCLSSTVRIAKVQFARTIQADIILLLYGLRLFNLHGQFKDIVIYYCKNRDSSSR